MYTFPLTMTNDQENVSRKQRPEERGQQTGQLVKTKYHNKANTEELPFTVL